MLEFLLSLADESDQDKILYIAEHFYSDMLAYARQRLQAAPIVGFEAEDAVQETYLRATIKIKCLDFNRSDGEIKRYMKEIMNGIIYNKRNGSSRDIVAESLNTRIPSSEDFISDLMNTYEQEAVALAIKQLEERYRVPLMLKYLSGYSVKDIAELLERSPKTVYTQIERGLLLLRNQLEQEGWGRG